MKIENRRKNNFRGEKLTSIPFSMKITVMDLWIQIEGTKLIYIMNFSVPDFFKFASRKPQTAQILVSTFKLFPREHAPGPPLKFPLVFFFSYARLCNAVSVLLLPTHVSFKVVFAEFVWIFSIFFYDTKVASLFAETAYITFWWGNSCALMSLNMFRDVFLWIHLTTVLQWLHGHVRWVTDLFLNTLGQTKCLLKLALPFTLQIHINYD